MTLDPPAAALERPQFTDLDQCRAWLKTLPLSNPVQAQAQLMRQLGLLNRHGLGGGARLVLLETLREPIHFVQEEGRKKFAGKPLPLTPAEQAAFDAGHGLWQALLAGYQRCLDACLAGDAELKPRAALICQRALATLVEDHLDQVRAGYQPAGGHWRQAHLIHAGAEELQAAATPCEDGLRAARPTTPAAAYAELMLLAAASLHELAPRQQGWVMRWARRWAGKVAIQAAPPAPDAPALPLCVDLAGGAPAGFKPLDGPGARWLVTTELRRSLKRRLKLLAAGGAENTPARLGLGDDCPQPQCGELLRRIYPRWVKGGIRRRHERHPLSGPCRLVVGVDAIHYYLSDRRPFKPPGSASTEDLRRQREELATFGRVAARFEEEYSRTHGYRLENWEIAEDWGTLDQSPGGLRLMRPLGREGGRLCAGQLAAVQPADAGSLLLGVVRWAQIDGDRLAVGIELLPGRPRPVAVRGTGVMAAGEKYRPGFLLPPVEALGLPASIVLPPASYKPERIVETWAEGATRQFRLKAALDRGADFERAACEEYG